MSQAGTDVSRLRIQPLEVAISALTGATGFLHLSLSLDSPAPVRFPLPGLFLLNGIGFLVLIMLLYLPALHPYQRALRWLLILYTVATLLCWVAFGFRNALGYLALGIELALLALLLLEEWQAIRQRAAHTALPL